MSFPLPNLDIPVTDQTGRLNPAWAGFVQRLHAVTGVTGTAISDPGAAVSSAPGTYDPVWAAEVVTLLNDIRANQIAILARMRALGEIAG